MGFEVVCPHCGGFVPARAAEPAMAGSSGSAEVDAGSMGWGGVDPASADWGSGADLIAAPSPDLEPGPDPETPDDAPGPAFALHLGPPRAVDAPTAAEPSTSEVESATAGPAWPSRLLASYASAATLALIYLLWLAPRRSSGPDSLPADTRAGSSAVAPVAPGRLTRLGEPLRVGLLEWTPVEVRRGRVGLRRAGGGRSQGAPGSLILRMRLRNLSTTEAFAPLEPAFARRPDQGPPDALVVAEAGDGPPIEPYPLAPRSEQSLDGQSFDLLKPGQERETIVATEPLDPGRELAPSTWRLRLRVGPGQTEVVGVRFAPGDVR